MPLDSNRRSCMKHAEAGGPGRCQRSASQCGKLTLHWFHAWPACFWVDASFFICLARLCLCCRGLPNYDQKQVLDVLLLLQRQSLTLAEAVFADDVELKSSSQLVEDCSVWVNASGVLRFSLQLMLRPCSKGSATMASLWHTKLPTRSDSRESQRRNL